MKTRNNRCDRIILKQERKFQVQQFYIVLRALKKKKKKKK
jgi:hypothetical protein